MKRCALRYVSPAKGRSGECEDRPGLRRRSDALFKTKREQEESYCYLCNRLLLDGNLVPALGQKPVSCRVETGDMESDGTYAGHSLG